MFEQTSAAVAVAAQAANEEAERKSDAVPERPIKLDEIKGDTIQNLILLHMSAKTAANDLTAAIEAVGEKAGIAPRVLRRYVNACAGNHLADRRKDAEQLSLLFEEVKL